VSPTARIFFLHVMKTGGASFRQVIASRYDAAELFPDPAQDDNLRGANLGAAELIRLPAERHAQIRAYTGHFPYYATTLVPGPLVTLTVLRNPVDRTVSYLKHCKRYHDRHRELSLEAIYDDGWINPMNIRDHQAKVFSLEPSDGKGTIVDVIDVDDRRLSAAKANLETVDIIGIHEDYDDFLDVVSGQLGWQIDNVPRLRAGEEEWDVSSSFRRRIAEDNAADVAFYEFARELVKERRRDG
jgi:hypothetical protein